MKTQITKNSFHPMKRLWLPGLVGIGANLVLLLISLVATRGLNSFFILSFLFSPIVATICLGAFVEGFRYFILGKGPAHNASISSLRVLDMVLGLLGLCPLVLRALASQNWLFGLNEIVTHIVILLLLSLLGYVFLSNLVHRGVLRLSLAGLAWIPYWALTFLVANQWFFELRHGYSWRNAAINDLQNLAALGYQYRRRPTSMGGGGGSYAGFAIPDKMKVNENSTYVITSLSPDTVMFMAMTVDSSGTILVKLDPEGKLAGWTFVGAPESEGDLACLIWIKKLVGE